ncbi:signal peptide peptidase SppA [Lichenihabitans psoromatis]|uniref:signal peptide peptidase SppA n=1 Tax=Lichenihabitans psoromatis TaxID=2528642 RepID=UPI0010383942|nr:signal peptide peptidase SppA [Lichenihabitans psoromatis]
MSHIAGSTADYLVDRRRMRRKLFFWRAIACVIVALALVGIGLQIVGPRGAGTLVPHIARLKIQGVITGDDATIKLLDEIATSNATALILSLESPGGTTVGSERLYDAIRKVAAKKPVVATVGTMAASGAYIAALGADHIVARGNSLVGSIGVLFEFPNVSGLLDKVGVKVETVKSAPLKASPNGFEPTSDAARAALASLVSDSFDWFKALVKDRRHMSDTDLAAVDDGRVFTGRQSMPLKLIDQIGSEEDAVAWLETQKGVAKGLPIRDWKTDRSLERLGLFGAAATLADGLGWPMVGHLLHQTAALEEAPKLDGLVSIWQGSGVN